MDSSHIDISDLPQLLHIISKPLYPRTAGDLAALIVAICVTTAYLLRGIVWDKPDPYHYIYFEKPQENASQQSGPKATRNIVQKLQEASKDCVIFWGSQSGTAEAFAGRLAKECQLRFSLKSIAADLSDYDPESIAQLPATKLVIFILSTYGEGDPSDNAAGLWDWVNKDQSTALNGVRYAAFGLGNKNYKYYNRVVDVVAEKLDRWGARKIIPIGKADDAARSTQEDFMAWKDELFAVFRTDMQLEEQSIQYQPTLRAIEDESLEPIDLYQDEPKFDGKASSKNSAVKQLTIKNSRELFNSGSRNCVHMELDIADHPELNYKTGDHLAVWPTNPEGEVQCLLQALGRTSRADVPILLTSLDPDVPIKVPAPATLATLLRSHLEICGTVSRDAVLGLVQFAPTSAAKAVVTRLAQDREHYHDLTQHTQLTLGRLLHLASPQQAWTDLPLSWVIETLPAIQPRYYSISSSSVLSPRRIAITALVAADDLPAVRPGADMPATVQGVTTNYLLALSTLPGRSDAIKYHLPSITPTSPSNLYAHIRKSKFKLPTSKATPIIMVAAGTGMAPFRAFIAERAKLAATSNGSVGRMLLFFGCRSPEDDYIYRDELERVVGARGWGEGEEPLLRIVTAFSRSTITNGSRHQQGENENENRQEKKKIYVQDRVAEHAGEVLRLLRNEGASLFVCGRTAMAKEVARVVGEAASAGTGIGGNAEEGHEWVEGLKRKGKWREDVWG